MSTNTFKIASSLKLIVDRMTSNTCFEVFFHQISFNFLIFSLFIGNGPTVVSFGYLDPSKELNTCWLSSLHLLYDYIFISNVKNVCSHLMYTNKFGGGHNILYIFLA